jgi:ribosomal protein S18 acetylase RimI-like enzyme
MSEITLETFDASKIDNVISVINEYISGWPYSRPVDRKLLRRWISFDDLQPENMLIAYNNGIPKAFLHGYKDAQQFNIYLLALTANADVEADLLLAEIENKAKLQKVTRICGPAWGGNRYYGGYILGCEPYHPHWAIDATNAYIRAGFRISHPAVILVRDAQTPICQRTLPIEYQMKETDAPAEFGADAFRYIAVFNGQEIATCTARIYQNLKDGNGMPVAQIGYVGTNAEHQGKGIAKTLVTTSISRLISMGSGDILIATGLDNYPALKAYESAGFRRKHNINEWSKDI